MNDYDLEDEAMAVLERIRWRMEDRASEPQEELTLEQINERLLEARRVYEQEHPTPRLYTMAECVQEAMEELRRRASGLPPRYAEREMVGPAAIATTYNGTRFRSRLEARWAIFMDAIREPWAYEPKTYRLRCGGYLPDFWLPQRELFVEIKPNKPREIEEEKCCELAEVTGCEVVLIYGAPGQHEVLSWVPQDGDVMCCSRSPWPSSHAVERALRLAAFHRFHAREDER